MKSLLALLLLASPATAGERWCNEHLPYDIERIPDGYAVVRISSADYCKDDGAGRFICNNRDDYRLDFDVNGSALTLTYTDGKQATFQKCGQ